MPKQDRAEYFRQRRQTHKQVVFMMEPELIAKLDENLKQKGEGRTEWFRRKVKEEVGE